MATTGGETRWSVGGRDGSARPIVIDVRFRARSHGGARDHSHSNQKELRTSFEWSHGGLDAGKLAGDEGIILPPFSISFLEALEADLGLAPVEKSVQNRIYYGDGVAVTEIGCSGPAARGGASGTFLDGGQFRCTTFFNTVILIYYKHVFDEVGT